MNTLDILIRQSYFAPHLAPIWNALPKERRGRVYVLSEIVPEISNLFDHEYIQPYTDGGYCGDGFILTASYGDAMRPLYKDINRPVILMEHGIGFTFGNAAYIDGAGPRAGIPYFLYPNQAAASRVRPELQNKISAVIGMPKLDKWMSAESREITISMNHPTVAISFHHGDKNGDPGVVGSAWEHYTEILPALAKRYKLLLHAHPVFRNDSPLRELYKQIDAEFTPDFDEVMRRADLYINDASSTAYEFLVTGKPVILLNAPWFDRFKNYGIRFWDYADIGYQVNEPSQLSNVIDTIIDKPYLFQEARNKAIADLFPYLGRASERAVQVVMQWMK